jgi:hypothetical protein
MQCRKETMTIFELIKAKRAEKSISFDLEQVRRSS